MLDDIYILVIHYLPAPLPPLLATPPPLDIHPIPPIHHHAVPAHAVDKGMLRGMG